MEPLSQILSEVTSALDRIGIRYAVGGSVASSVRGIYRSTLDVDLVAEIVPQGAEALEAALGPEWYADAHEIRRAIKAGRSFNLIHTRLAFKVDIFPAYREFHLAQLERATIVPLGEGVPCRVASAEDILLAKLCWYRDGGCVSERQWDDIAGLLAVNPDLDRTYLDEWTVRLGVADLLEKARAEATEP